MMITGGSFNNVNNWAVLKKVNIFSVDQASDNDQNNRLIKEVMNNFTVALRNNYNISTSLMIINGAQNTTSYTSTSCTPSFSSNQVSKSSCLSSPNQFTSKLSYFQNLSFTVFVQSGKSKTEAFIEPWFISSSTDNVIFSIPLSFAWVNYNRQKGEVIFNGPNTLNADFMNFTVPLIRISSNMENLAVYYYVKVYSCKVTNWDT